MPAPNVSGRTQLDGPTHVVDLDKTEATKAVMRGYFRDVVFGGQRDKVAQYKSLDHFHQHNCDGEDNKSGFQTKTGYSRSRASYSNTTSSTRFWGKATSFL